MVTTRGADLTRSSHKNKRACNAGGETTETMVPGLAIFPLFSTYALFTVLVFTVVLYGVSLTRRLYKEAFLDISTEETISSSCKKSEGSQVCIFYCCSSLVHLCSPIPLPLPYMSLLRNPFCMRYNLWWSWRTPNTSSPNNNNTRTHALAPLGTMYRLTGLAITMTFSCCRYLFSNA